MTSFLALVTTTESSLKLRVYLKSAATSEWSVENAERFTVPEVLNHPRVTLTMAILHDTPAEAVFSRYSGYASMPKKRGAFRHTLLALVDR